jgi:hypothetical protein
MISSSLALLLLGCLPEYLETLCSSVENRRALPKETGEYYREKKKGNGLEVGA